MKNTIVAMQARGETVKATAATTTPAMVEPTMGTRSRTETKMAGSNG